ncbi:MAG: NAD(P)H-dependent oxidoreductase [Smithella sp.]
MRVTVLNGSPKGDVSVTMQYVNFIAKKFPEHDLKIINISQHIKPIEKNEARFKAIVADMEGSDLIIWAFPVYVCLVPSQYKRFIELLFERKATGKLSGKYSTAITTSVHFYDHTAHNYIQSVSEDMGMQHIGGYSADMHDLMEPQEREKFLKFANHVFETVEKKNRLAKSFSSLPLSIFKYNSGKAKEAISSEGKKILVLTDAVPGQDNLIKMVNRFCQSFSERVEVINLRELDIKGGCLGCYECGYDNTCVYSGKDGFSEFYKNRVGDADIVIFAGTIRDRYLSSMWKCYFDRVFFNTHIPTLTGKQTGFIISGPLCHITNLRQILESYCEWQQSNLAGIVTDESENDTLIDENLQVLAESAMKYSQEGYFKPRTFFAVAGMKLFRDEVWGRIRFVFQADHRYYKKHGFYDFPQKDFKTQGINLVLCTLMKIPAFRKEFKKRIKTEMIKPLQNVVKNK